jgi:hypothetical protein
LSATGTFYFKHLVVQAAHAWPATHLCWRAGVRFALAFMAARKKAAHSTSTSRLEAFGEGKLDTTSAPAYNVNKM